MTVRTAYYNEFDPYAAQWLRNLIDAGLIAPGDVDERSIEDVRADELVGYRQCHFFAGLGGWSLALRMAGWPDERAVWSGSCPCQPFSAAGKQEGTSDARHLWPVWFDLIGECRPGVVFGEQVEAAIRHDWLDLVQADMESVGYALAPLVLPAAGFGAPHGRHRLWFVGYAVDEGLERLAGDGDKRNQPGRHDEDAAGSVVGVADGAQRGRREERAHGRGEPAGDCTQGRPAGSGAGGLAGELADANRRGSPTWNEATAPDRHGDSVESNGCIDGASTADGFWRNADWLLCRDGRWRPVEPGTFPLAHGIPARVGRLRAYGNAIVPQVAAELIGAFMAFAPDGATG